MGLSADGADGVAGLAVSRLASDSLTLRSCGSRIPRCLTSTRARARQKTSSTSRRVRRREGALSPRTRAPVQRAVFANGWHWLDLNEYMCGHTECGIILGDVFMYRDNDHLSATFASKLSPALMDAVLPLVRD